jgi:hypothetical protein
MRLLSWICTEIFLLTEHLHINLGRLTPWVFPGMLGTWPHKVTKDDPGSSEPSRRAQVHSCTRQPLNFFYR